MLSWCTQVYWLFRPLDVAKSCFDAHWPDIYEGVETPELRTPLLFVARAPFSMCKWMGVKAWEDLGLKQVCLAV
jgi:hypothetical protein